MHTRTAPNLVVDRVQVFHPLLDHHRLSDRRRPGKSVGSLALYRRRLNPTLIVVVDWASGIF